jgi:hypothetical protein
MWATRQVVDAGEFEPALAEFGQQAHGGECSDQGWEHGEMDL